MMASHTEKAAAMEENLRGRAPGSKEDAESGLGRRR